MTRVIISCHKMYIGRQSLGRKLTVSPLVQRGVIAQSVQHVSIENLQQRGDLC